MLAKSLKATVAGETQRFEAQQARHTKSQQEAIQAALNQQHVEFLKKMGDQERTSAARMQAVIDSAKRHQRETLQQSLAGAAKTHNLAAAKLQQQLKQSEARARKLGEQAKRVHEQMTQLADRESAMVQQHKSELAAVNQQLQVSDARIQASQEETKMQRMEFERNRDKMSTEAYHRSVAMLEAKAKEHEEILKENTRNLEQNAQIMQREAANAAAWAAKEHSEKQQQLSNAMARQKQEMQTQMNLKEAEHKQEMDASRAAMQLQQEFHDTSQSLRAEPANQAELAKMQHIVSNNIEFKRAGQQFEQEHRRFLNAPALRPPQMPVLVEDPEIKEERPISPPSQLLDAPVLAGAAEKRFDLPKYAYATQVEIPAGAPGPTPVTAATVLDPGVPDVPDVTVPDAPEIGRKRTREEQKADESGYVELYPAAQFHFEKTTPTIQSTLDATLPTSSETEKQLIEMVKQRPRSRVQSLAERLGLADSQVTRVLKDIQTGVQEGMLAGRKFSAVPAENLVTEGYDAAFKLYESRQRAEQLKQVKSMEEYNETESDVQASIARDQARLSEMIKGIDAEMDRRRIDKPSDWRLTPEQTANARARLDKHRAMAQQETEAVMGTDDPQLNQQITAQRAEILHTAEKAGSPQFSFVTSQQANESLKRAADYVKKPWWQASSSQYSQADLRKVQKDQTMGRVLLTMIARQRNRTVQRQRTRLTGPLKKYSLASQQVGTVERSIHEKGFDKLTPKQLTQIQAEYKAITTMPTVWEQRSEGYQKAAALLPVIQTAIDKFARPGVATSQIAEAFVKSGTAGTEPKRQRASGMKKPRKTSKRRKKKAKTPKKTAPKAKKEKPAPKTALQKWYRQKTGPRRMQL